MYWNRFVFQSLPLGQIAYFELEVVLAGVGLFFGIQLGVDFGPGMLSVHSHLLEYLCSLFADCYFVGFFAYLTSIQNKRKITGYL